MLLQAFSLLQNKINKRILAAILAACSLFCLCACNQEVENIKGENTVGGYSFSYPETWELISNEKDTVISIADVGGGVPYAVMSFKIHQSGGKTAEEYWSATEGDYAKLYSEAEISKKQSFDFAGGTAFEAVIKATVIGFTNLDGQPDKAEGKAVYYIRQLVFQKEDRLCVVSYMAEKSNDGKHNGAFAAVKKSFKFTSPQKAEDDGIEGADFDIPTPEGWTLTTKEAFYKLNKGKASITASVFSVKDNATTAKDCWEKVYVPDFNANFAEFAMIGELKEKDIDLGGVPAVEAEYTLTTHVGGTYSFRQITAVYYGYVYTVVLTASADDYADCVAGYEAVVAGFKFK